MAEKQAPQTVVFAKLGDKGFIAGISLDAILKDANNIFPDVPRKKVVLVQEKDIPESYKWSVRAVTDFNDWQSNGTYLLIEHFERYRAFRDYFPDVEI